LVKLQQPLLADFFMLWFKFSWKTLEHKCSKLLVLCLRLSKKLLGTGNSNTQRFSIGDFINGSLTWAMKNRLVQNRIPLMNCDTPHWLVVLTILKNFSQWEGLSPIYGKIKHVPNHQPAHDIWSYIFRTKNQPNKPTIPIKNPIQFPCQFLWHFMIYGNSMGFSTIPIQNHIMTEWQNGNDRNIDRH
jgi:hypothetical protein